MRAVLIAIVIAAGCGGTPKHTSEPPIEPSAELAAARALQPLAWWLGDWQAASGTEQWVAASGAIYGIALHEGTFEVMILDDGEGTGKPDGVVRFIAMPGGAPPVEFQQNYAAKRRASFANPAHDDPKQIVYWRDGDTLGAQVGETRTFAFTRASLARAPELEQADLAFAADTAARGIEGWVAAFDPAGAMMSKAGRVEGHDAIRALMGPLLETTKVEWVPIASGKRGALGWTVGKATFTGEESWRSTYVTIWKQQPDGAWKVLFDTGRPVQLSDSAPAAPRW